MCNGKCISTQIPCDGKCFDGYWKCPNEELCVPMDMVCNRIDLENNRNISQCKDNAQFSREVCEDSSLFNKTKCVSGYSKCSGNLRIKIFFLKNCCCNCCCHCCWSCV